MSTALKCELPGIWNLPLEGNAASCGNPNSRDGEVSRDVKWCNAIAVAGPVPNTSHFQTDWSAGNTGNIEFPV